MSFWVHRPFHIKILTLSCSGMWSEWDCWSSWVALFSVFFVLFCFLVFGFWGESGFLHCVFLMTTLIYSLIGSAPHFFVVINVFVAVKEMRPCSPRKLWLAHMNIKAVPSPMQSWDCFEGSTPSIYAFTVIYVPWTSNHLQLLKSP